MATPPALRAATTDELAEALSLARITADRLVAHLEASGFVVMKKPPAGAPTASRMPKSGG
jgi:predicted transcriptional regulator